MSQNLTNQNLKFYGFIQIIALCVLIISILTTIFEPIHQDIRSDAAAMDGITLLTDPGTTVVNSRYIGYSEGIGDSYQVDVRQNDTVYRCRAIYAITDMKTMSRMLKDASCWKF